MRLLLSKNILIIILAYSLVCLPAGGQDRQINKGESRPPLSERLFFGGSFGLQFGTITNIELSPVAGAWILPRVALAAGPSWQYYKDPIGKTSIYGGRGYLRLILIRDFNRFIPLGINFGLFTHAEYEALSLENDFWSLNPSANTRIWQHNALLGVGLSQPLGRKSSLNIYFLWAVTESDYRIYDNPEVRIDFLF
jgi:hypothetical protein